MQGGHNKARFEYLRQSYNMGLASHNLNKYKTYFIELNTQTDQVSN